MRFINIKYPKNRADAIKLTRTLDASWGELCKERGKKQRAKILEVSAIVRSALAAAEGVNQTPEIEQAIEILRGWAKKHRISLS